MSAGPRLGAALILSALTLAALALAVGGCGDDAEPERTTQREAIEERPETTTTIAPEPQPEPEPEPDSGGLSAPDGTDDGAHEGGGPDPGSGEGGTGGGGSGGGGSGGGDPTEAFERYCEENPRACS